MAVIQQRQSQVAGQSCQFLDQRIQVFDLLDEIESGSLPLDFQYALGKVLELSGRIVCLQSFQKTLQYIELLPLIVPFLSRDQFAALARQARLNVLGVLPQ